MSAARGTRSAEDIAPYVPRLSEERDEPYEPRRRTAWLWPVAALVAAVAVVAFLLLPGVWSPTDGQRDTATRQRDSERTERSGSPGERRGGQVGAPASETSEGRSGKRSPAKVPSGWSSYRDPTTGYSVRYPPAWQVTTEGTMTEFRDPISGTYLRVQPTPPSGSPLQAWEEFSQTFAASHENYTEIRIEATTFRGREAAVWEFTYTEGGTELHAIDLRIAAEDYDYAFNFQTHAEDWEDSQDVFAALKRSFRMLR